MKKKRKSFLVTLNTCICLIAILVLSIICLNKIAKLYYKHDITKNATLLCDGKVVKMGNVSGYMLTGHKYGETIEITTKIKDSKIKNPVIMFNNIIDAGVRIYIDEELIYQHGMDAKKNSVVCNDKMIIPLYKSCNNKTIRIILRCTNSGVFAKLPNIYYMNSKDASCQNLADNILLQSAGISLICLGVICIILFIFNIGVNVVIKQIIFVSIGSICGGLWILSCYQVLNLFIDSYKVDFYAEYISMYLMLLFFNLYVEDITQDERDKKLLKIMQKIWIVYTIFAFAAQIFNIVYMNDSIIGLHIISLPILFVTIKYYIKKVKTDGLGYSFIYGLVIITVIICSMYFVMHVFKTSISVVDLLPLLVFFFVIGGIVNGLLELKKAYSTQAEKDALVNLIYIDKLTGISNRRGLDKYNDNIKRVGIHYDYTVYSIDLNELKYVNDTYGHSAGDKLIINFANQVKKVVNKDGFCGRMGGDEFVVIVRDDEYSATFEDKLKQQVLEYNNASKDEYKLQYSIGSSSYKVGGTVNLDDVIRMADYNMYEMKTKFHRKSRKSSK